MDLSLSSFLFFTYPRYLKALLSHRFVLGWPAGGKKGFNGFGDHSTVLLVHLSRCCAHSPVRCAGSLVRNCFRMDYCECRYHWRCPRRHLLCPDQNKAFKRDYGFRVNREVVPERPGAIRRAGCPRRCRNARQDERSRSKGPRTARYGCTCSEGSRNRSRAPASWASLR